MRVRPAGARLVGYRYRCADGCYSRSGRLVDVLVLVTIEKRLSRPDLADVLASSVDDAKAEELLRESRRLQDRLAVHEADYDAGFIDGHRYKEARDKTIAEIRHVENERARLLAGAGPAAVLTAKDPAAAFRGASLMQQRAVVDFFATVTLHPSPPRLQDLRPQDGDDQAEEATVSTIRVVCDDASHSKGRVATLRVLERGEDGWHAVGHYRPHSDVWHVPEKTRRTLADDKPMTVADELERGAESLDDLTARPAPDVRTTSSSARCVLCATSDTPTW